MSHLAVRVNDGQRLGQGGQHWCRWVADGLPGLWGWWVLHGGQQGSRDLTWLWVRSLFSLARSLCSLAMVRRDVMRSSSNWRLSSSAFFSAPA